MLATYAPQLRKPYSISEYDVKVMFCVIFKTARTGLFSRFTVKVILATFCKRRKIIMSLSFFITGETPFYADSLVGTYGKCDKTIRLATVI